MSAKVKLISFISAFVLVLGIMIIGVLSAEQVQVNIGGSVSFNATNVYAKVSGNISGAETGNKTFSTLTYSAEETTGNESDWTNLTLEFTETPDPIVITITVENLSTQRTLTVNLENTLQGEGLDIAVTRDSGSYTSAANVELPVSTGDGSSTTTFTVTLTVANLDEDLTDATFGYILNMFDESVEIPISDFTFTTSGDTATLTEYTGAGGDVVIPSTISLSADGTAIVGSDYTVTAIASSTSYSSGPFISARSTLTSITIPETVETIGNYAFYGCRELIEINYNATNANNLTSGNRVFYNAGQNGDGITVNIGANVESLPNYIFNPYGGSSYAPNITTVDFAKGSKCESISTYAFSSCSSLTSITIPSSVTRIDASAFEGCSSLTSITIPVSVTSIGNSAFASCFALAEVYNYSSLTITNNIGNGYAGNYAKVIYNLSAGDSKPATRITVVDNMQYYEYGDDFIALSPTSRNVTEVRIDSRTTEINQSAFSWCDSLTSITIPASVTSIGQAAFISCNFNSVTIDSSYAYQNAGADYDECGYLLQGANIVYVNANLVGSYTASSYLTSNFTRSETVENGYYVYTRN